MGLKKPLKKEISDQQRALITEFDKRSPISEQFRTLRTNIQFASVDKKIKTIMVTSSSPAEGKSTVVANLSIVLAQQENKVLLVDTDLRKPTVHFSFQLPNQAGFTNVLTLQSRLEEMVFHTSIAHLDILPSGPLPPNPSEMLASNKMKEFMREAEKKYDYVIFDTPPLNAVTDPQIISSLVEGVILVVRSGKTEAEKAVKAVSSLKKMNANLLGAVLNDCPIKDSPYYHYYQES